MHKTSVFSGPAKRNAIVLSGMQALGGANPAVIVALGGLIGSQLASSVELATLPVSLFNVGLALGILPAAYIMKRLGRKYGYVLGALLGASGGLLAFYGIYQSSFTIFCIGTLLAGLYASYVQSYRFAAADSVSAEWKPKAISWVMIGGLAAAVIATKVILFTRDLFPALPFAATFLVHALLALLILPLVALLKSEKELGITARDDKIVSSGRPLIEIALQPRFIIAAIAGISAYSLMNFLMTATPLAMMNHGHDIKDSTLGIQWHILAMFGPSFFTGHLIKKFGKVIITFTGLLLIGLASVVALNGLSVPHFWLSLVLLGLGWNFGFIGATAMVTDCYRPEERNRVQALNDFMIFTCVAISSFSSGQVLARAGWESINRWTFPVVGFVMMALLWLWFYEKRQVTQHAA